MIRLGILSENTTNTFCFDEILVNKRFNILFHKSDYEPSLFQLLQEDNLDILLIDENKWENLNKNNLISNYIRCKILILSKNQNHVETTLNYFPTGFCFFIDDSSIEELTMALVNIHKYGAYISPILALAILKRLPYDPLIRYKDVITRRESEIIALVCEGMTYRQIAERLFITSFTVNQHLKKIYTKLNVHSKSELVSKILNIK